MKKILMFSWRTVIVVFFMSLWTCPIWLGGCKSPAPKYQTTEPQSPCDCPGYIKKDLIEYQYEQLIRPLVIEAVGFQGMVLKDSIGTVFVITDDKALHEVLQYSYNVGDTIQ